MTIGGKPIALTVLNGGINRLRNKGGTNPHVLYDFQNGYITAAGNVVPREGSLRNATLSSATVGLTGYKGGLCVFSTSQVAVPSGYSCNVLAHPTDATQTLLKIWFAKPFMGFLYVVAEFANGDIFHYWLQSQGAWTGSTVFQVGAIITPTTPNGLAYQATRLVGANPTWAEQTLTSADDIVEPTVANGYYYTATAVDGSSPHTGSVEPTWPTTIGGVVQEFGDFTVGGNITSDGTVAATPLSTSITDRYGDSNDIAGGSNTTGAVAATSLPTASTTVATWAGGTLYQPGAIVIPSTSQGAFVDAIPNGDFENGNDGSWVFSGTGGQWGIEYNPGGSFAGSYRAYNAPAVTSAYMTMATGSDVTPGTSVTATAMLNTETNTGSAIEISIGLHWYNSGGTLLSSNDGGAQTSHSAWKMIGVTATAPAGAATVKVYLHAASGTASRDTGVIDNVSWNLEVPSASTNFLYEAVQTGAATSGTTEPTWPVSAGATVTDGGVTWQAVGSSIITWTASPIMESSGTEPTWPTTIGATVSDGNMAWTTIARQIIDTNCPNTKGVVLGASHVFAIDKDIVAYSAAVDPTDWTSANDAGYLPTGLNDYGSDDAAVLGLYRGNLMVFNAGGYQMWQIDPDPQQMALLDAQPIGSTATRSCQSVANDLLFLTAVGVRNIATVGATANMALGSTGQPVDPLVLAALQAGTYDPLTIYYPGRGQYWLIFGPQVFVMTMNGSSTKTWARYIFPDVITDGCLLDEVIYLRSAGNLVWQIEPAALNDDELQTSATVTITQATPSVVTWTAHGQTNGTLVYLTTTGTLPLPLLPNVAYYVVSQTTNTLELSLTSGGAAIATTTAGSGTHTGHNIGQPITGFMQWGYLDGTALGYNDMFCGLDLIGSGMVEVAIGYDETNFSITTVPYLLQSADTVVGQPIGMAVNAPSYSIQLTWLPNQSWKWDGINLYLQDNGNTG